MSEAAYEPRGILTIHPKGGTDLAYREPCGVCGRRVVCTDADKRRGPEGWMRCQDHLGAFVDASVVPPGVNILDMKCSDCEHEWREHDAPYGCKECERENERLREDDQEPECRKRHPAMPARWWSWTCPICSRTALGYRGTNPTGCAFCDRSHVESRGPVNLVQRGPVVVAFERRGRRDMTVPVPGWWP